MYKKCTKKPLMPYCLEKMRNLVLGTVILIVFLLATSAVKAQTITVNFKKTPLRAVLKELRKQSHYNFVIADDLVGNAPAVNLTVVNASLKTALDQLFKNSPLTYAIDKQSVIITEKTGNATPPQQKQPDRSITVVGSVRNEDNEALEGANVRVKGKDEGTTTMANGIYSLKGLEDGDILQITYLGYAPAEIPATNQLTAGVLKHATSARDEVQVIFNGKSSLRTSTGAQTTITHEQLAVSPAPNILEAMAGLVPGLVITQNGPNAGSTFAI